MARVAQCRCGSFRTAVDVEPAAVGVCSWLNCQRRSGSIIGAIAYFLQDGIRVISGEYKTYVRY
jgi:hypothetical protein